MAPGPTNFEGISVREASWSDLDRLVEFNAAMARETESRQLDRDRLRAGTKAVLDSHSRGVYWVGEVSSGSIPGIVVGQLLITFEWSDWRNANFWWMQSVYVHPDWRNQGIFRNMYQHVVNQAKSRPDVCGIRLYVEQDNMNALSVYAKLGLLPTHYRLLETDYVLPKKRNES